MNPHRYFAISLLTVLLGLGSNGFSDLGETHKTPRFTLWQLPSQGPRQMQSYVVQSEAGRVIVIDGGMACDGDYLKRFIADRGNHVDSWFITHPHEDHIDALTWILSNPGDLEIDSIYASFPSVEWIQQHEKGTTHSLTNFIAALENAGRSYIDVEQGAIFDIDEIHIEILSVENPGITLNAVNNSSLVMRFSDPAKSILFTGDIGVRAGDKILKTVDPRKLKADYVQMAHHGQGCAGKNFYEVVQPEYCLWPTPLWLWNNDSGGGYDSGPWGTLETRKWMDELNVKKHYVSAFGLVEIK